MPILTPEIEKKKYFVDLFTGGLNVSLNVNCDNIISIDNNKILIDLYKNIKKTNINYLINFLENNPLDTKEKYLELRKNYNIYKSWLDLLKLHYSSFNNMFRFNSKNDFNLPYGIRYFKEIHKENLINIYNKLQYITLSNCDFQEFNKFYNINSKDLFFYYDPPYINTDTTYNSKHTQDTDEQIYQSLQYNIDNNIDNNISFTLSNCLFINNKHNDNLTEFINKNVNKINVYNINKQYNIKGKLYKNDAKEVLITNF